MKIHCYLLSYNVESLIRYVLDYYSGFCSRIFIMDNMSTDNSVAIAREYPAVTIIPWESGGEHSESGLTHMKSQTYRRYSRAGGQFTEEVADWVISCDMDEFLYHPDLPNVLARYKTAGITVPKVRGFDMVSEADPDPQQSFLQQYRMGFRNTVFDKRVVFQPEFNMPYSVGAHSQGPGFALMKQTLGYQTSQDCELVLLHYKRIGSLFQDFAKQYFNRLPEKLQKLAHENRFHGGANHYLPIAEGKMKRVPPGVELIEVLDEKGQLNADAQGEDPSENGNDQFAQATPVQAKLLRELLAYWTPVDPHIARQLLSVAAKFHRIDDLSEFQRTLEK